uniref:hypothetical protein n=1 Tax=Rhizobium sp. F40D2 TaxID=3453141 RepID=UPI003F1E8544
MVLVAANGAVGRSRCRYQGRRQTHPWRDPNSFQPIEAGCFPCDRRSHRLPNSRRSIVSASNGCATPPISGFVVRSARLSMPTPPMVEQIGLRLKDEAVESLIAAWDRDYDP